MRGQPKRAAFTPHRPIIVPDNENHRDKRIDDGREPL
jgi:hypothetical protein